MITQHKTIVYLSTLFLLAAVTAGIACAQEPAEMDEWQFSIALYGYLPDISGDAVSGSDIDYGQDTIIDDLNFTIMGILGAQKGKWEFAADVIYLDLGDDENGTVSLPSGRQVNWSSDTGLTAWMVTPRVGYNVLLNDRFKLNILAGARYVSLDVDVGLNVGRIGISASDSKSVWDAIVGANGHVTLGEKWFLPYYIDIGTGESDLTFQVFGGVGYRFSMVDLVGGYRYLRYDFDDDSLLDNLYLSGPMVGINFRF